MATERERARAESPALRVEVLHDRGAIAALRQPWQRLRRVMSAAGYTAGPFVDPDWLSIFAASLAAHPARDARFELWVVHAGGELVAALPLLRGRRRVSGIPARVLASVSDDHSSRFDLVVDPERAAAASRVLVQELLQRRDWDALELQVIPDQGAAAEHLIDAARAASLPEGDWPSLVSPYLALPGDVAQLDALLDAKFRANLRRRRRKLESDVGPLRLERCDGSGLDAQQLEAALDEGFRLEAAGWKGDAGTAIACDPQLRARYLALAHCFAARGQLACYFLRAGERRVAFHFALVDDGVYYLFKPGYDPALARYGLGHLLVDDVARDLIARQVREIDFLGDAMDWKAEWTQTTRSHRSRYLFAPTARGRALAAWKCQLWPAVKELSRRVWRQPASPEAGARPSPAPAPASTSTKLQSGGER